LWRYGGAWMSASWQNPDVFFCPTPTTVNLRSRFKKVVTVHDVSPVVMPVFAPASIVRKLRYSLGRASRSSDAVIAVSIQSKQDLIEVYGLAESKICVVYSGYDKEHFNTSAPDRETLSALLKRHIIGALSFSPWNDPAKKEPEEIDSGLPHGSLQKS